MDYPYTEYLLGKIILQVQKLEPLPSANPEFQAGEKSMQEEIIKIIKNIKT